MNHSKWLAGSAAAALSIAAALGVPSAQAAIDISQVPLFTTVGQPPLMMMVMSRDEQLFKKAYPDYTDLDGDGIIDTTYQNRFEYSGYFDSNLCYSYDNGAFQASAEANNFQCNGSTWSGNFMNWATMSRLDVLRFVFYGGRRSVDTVNETVLERSHIPNDLHAWSKVYDGADINSYTPLSAATTFCNASFGTDDPPIMRGATGIYAEWAATALSQCKWRTAATCTGGDNSSCDDGYKGNKVEAGSNDGDFTVRVRVCRDGDALRESFCRAYTPDGSTQVFKPAGLLQTYGEDGSMRFGLLTGSFSNPRSGGILRRNIGLFAGNAGPVGADGCAPEDEVSLRTGIFCNKTDADEGIVKTMDALRLRNWNGSKWTDCNNYGILNRSGGPENRYLDNPGPEDGHKCSAWGNPLSEMYAEALRYIAGGYNASHRGTPGFWSGTDLEGLPNPIWRDPYRAPSEGGNPYCANCSILVLSTGLNSFDSDEIPEVSRLRTAAASTTHVGQMEGISGDYLVGRISTGTPGDLAVGVETATYTDLCDEKNVTDFSLVRGLCPDIPAMEGSYLLAGLAYDAWTRDLRPDLADQVSDPKPRTYKNKVKTFGISLAENLPKFEIPVGGSSITMAPLCQANNTGGAGLDHAEWRSCFLGSVSIGQKKSLVNPYHVYGRDLEDDGSAGSFTWVWEDSLWGNDHDNDVVTMVTYCVGSQCSKDGSYSGYDGHDICWRTGITDGANDRSPVCGSAGRPVVAADETLVRIENVSAYAGNAMLTGYAMTGSDDDGLKRLALRPGNSNGTILTAQADPPGNWYRPMVRKYKAGTASAGQLENPLFYAAKYGGFQDRNNNDRPDPGEWDSREAGEPDNFFAVTNPAELKRELSHIFEQIMADARPTASVATSTPRYTHGSTLVYEASFDATDWSGDLKAFRLHEDGVYTNTDPVWLASESLPAPSVRRIFTSRTQQDAFTNLGTPFTVSGLTNEMKQALLGDLDPTTFGMSEDELLAALVDYLRGNQSLEQDSVPPGPFRIRSSPFGDVLNSSPVVAGVTSFGYGEILRELQPAAAEAYPNFVQSKNNMYASGQRPVVYVGANDGMLHAIDGRDGGTGGEELFAYVPNAVVQHLSELARPGYFHRYFVDGSPTLTDAYIANNWRTVLLGSTGAGARGVYALDVTNPDGFDTGNVLWEFNANGADEDSGLLGHAIGRPWVGYSENGWVAAFGNGYNSDGNEAVLFVRDLATGAKVATVPVGVGCTEDGCDPSNGLSGAVLVDNDGNGGGDTIYAGDYLGNLWRFDYSGGTWAVGNSGNPLFVARDPSGKRQAITSAPYTVAHPLGGTMVIFGTGRYLGHNDADPLQVGEGSRAAMDTVYGVLDSRSCTEVTSSRCTQWSATVAINGRGDLQQQRITHYTPLGSDGTGGTRSATRNPVDYHNGGGNQMGWYLDLSCRQGSDDSCATGATSSPSLTEVMHGERVTVRPDGILADVIINTIRPEGATCEPGVLNATLALDALTGAASYVPVYGGGAGGGASQGGMVGVDTYRGPPQGEPPVLIVRPETPGVPCLPGAEGCEEVEPIIGGASSCSWVSPNPTNHPPGKPMPCGRISWRQMR